MFGRLEMRVLPNRTEVKAVGDGLRQDSMRRSCTDHLTPDALLLKALNTGPSNEMSGPSILTRPVSETCSPRDAHRVSEEVKKQ